MTAELWQEVDAIVAEALDLPLEERSTFVERACANRPEVASEVHSLLAVSVAAGDFLEAHTAAEAAANHPEGPPAPRSVGPYRLLEEVGHGGMSVVYRAERDDGQFRKVAAVKLLATGWIAPEAMRRFLAERQILASLEHPNICRLLDGGVTATGAPYLVMEFVDGLRLLDYCREKQLGERERLELFCRICQAVQFAHQNLVVHRDIKPGNVLVTREADVKLMDFGIAKVLAESAAGDQTQTGFGAMTPDYASPEQIKRQPITTQSDIYSLGVLLYELLVGRRPYETSGRGLDGLLNIVNQSDAPAAPGLRPELLAIVRCAMCKNPSGRYAATSALEDDVRRYLAGIPVRAVSPTRWYSFRKWVARHRIPVMAGTVAAMLILGASAVAWRQAVVAQRERAAADQRFDQVRQLAKKVMFSYTNSLERAGVATGLQQQMASDSLAYLDSLGSDPNASPEVMLELADGYVRVGELLGAPRHLNLGDRSKAQDAFHKARDLAEKVYQRNPALPAARLKMARILSSLAFFAPDHSRQLAQQSLDLLHSLYLQNPGDPTILEALTTTYQNLAMIDYTHPEYAQQALEFAEKWRAAANGAEKRTALGHLARTHRIMAQSLLIRNEFESALDHGLKAQAADEMIATPGGGALAMALDLNVTARSYAGMNQLTRARDFFQQSEQVSRQAYNLNPGDELVRRVFLEAVIWEGWIAERLGDRAHTRALYQEAVRIAPTLRPKKLDRDWNLILGEGYGSYGLLLKREGQPIAACDPLRQSRAYYDAAGKPHPEITQALAGCPNSH